MTPQLAPSKWTCLITSFAMAANFPVSFLISAVGHDGSEVIWPELPEPYCRRGHHPQEIIWELAKLGFDVCPYEACPVSVSGRGGPIYPVPMAVGAARRMSELMVKEAGVLTGETSRGKPHAVAWDGEKVLDPNGTEYPLDNFVLQTFWKIKSP